MSVHMLGMRNKLEEAAEFRVVRRSIRFISTD